MEVKYKMLSALITNLDGDALVLSGLLVSMLVLTGMVLLAEKIIQYKKI